jgi:hypothetical protein
MIIGWKNSKTFKRHIEEMESFRRTHVHFTPEKQLKIGQAVPVPFKNNPPCWTEFVTSLSDDRGKEIIVPIWELSMPKGSQN